MFRVRALSGIRRIVVIAAACALGACGDRQPTAPPPPAAQPAPTETNPFLGLPSSSPKLVQCATSETKSTSGTFDALGGTLSLDGSKVVLPVGALLEPTTIGLTIPASPYMEIDVKANDAEHFLFEKAILITIDYSRCNRFDLLFRPLTVWQIDPQTKELIERMGGVDNKLLRRITFSTTHFSGYAIAF
jgi:hypothetical protein